jgi:type IV pilus assembly protein PilW
MAPWPSIVRRQRGLTLVELLISASIGLVVLGSLLVVYLGSRAAYRSNDSLARVQESGRFAIEFIAQDARVSGFMGCRSRNLSEDDQTMLNITRNPEVTFSGSRDGVAGYDDPDSDDDRRGVDIDAIDLDDATRAEVKKVYLRGDVIAFRHAFGTAAGVSKTSEPEKATITLGRNTDPPLRKGDLAVLGNCQKTLLFHVTGVGAAVDQVVVRHETSGSPGNYDKPRNADAVPAFSVASRAELMRVGVVAYFVGRNAAGRPGLFRAADGAVEELVDNVENMDIVYGLDTTLDPDGIIDVYLRADQIAAADWSRVVSARVSLLVAGPEEHIATGRQTYAFGEAGGIAGKDGDGLSNTRQAPADGRLRQVFTTTVSLRNRVL